MKKRDYYSKEFKREAVRKTYESMNIMKVARELSIPYTLLYKWRKDFSKEEKNT